MTQVLALGSLPWEDPGGRSRRLLGALRDCALYYAEPGSGRGLLHAYERKAVGTNLVVLKPRGATVPWDSQNLLRRPLLGRQASLLNGLMYETRESCVLWCESPVRKSILDRIPHRKLVYDARNPEENTERLRDMAERAHVVAVSAQSTAEKLRDMSAKLCYLPDGTDFELYAKSGDPLLPFPQDLFHIREPILGHIGRPGEGAELGYITEAAAVQPDWNFVFLCDGEGLPAAKNIYYLGDKEQDRLPSYLHHFSLCFRIENAAVVEDLPASIFACFAAGKPLVTTLHPKRVLDFTEVIYLAHSPEAFLDGCRRALSERDAWRRKERIAYARASSWAAGASRLDAFLREKDVF